MTKASAKPWTGNPYRRPNSPYWHIVYTDASGTTRRRSTRSKDLRVARTVLSEQLREVERQKAGYVDRFATTRKMPLAKLVGEFQAHLEANDSAPRYIRGTIRQLREFVRFSGAGTVQDLRVSDADRFLAQIRSDRSAKTRDHYAGALRGFGSWLDRSGRWDSNPFRALTAKTARDRNRVFKRMSFRFEDAERLVEAAWARHEAERALGGTQQHEGYDDEVRDRQVLYWFVLTTGFRAAECASIRWEDLDLLGPRPSVRLSGEFTKNGDDARIPLQNFVIDALREVRARRNRAAVSRARPLETERDVVFHIPSKVAEIVRKDAAFAGLIPQRSATSKRVDFHCLRKTCARILIELNVHPKIIQQTLRHADIRLTMDLYGELGEDDLFRELPGTFPVPRMFGTR